MKTVDLSSEPLSAGALFEMARNESLLVKTDQGDTFVVSHADEFETEVELLRRNHEFLAMLDRLKEDRDRLPLEQVEKDLR